MKICLILICFPCLLLTGAPTDSYQGPFSQQNTAKTEIPGKGPCTNFPPRYHKLPERLAWFYGCMHENPPSADAIKTEIAAMPPEKRKAFENQDLITQEALLGVATYAIPVQVFPE